MVEVATIVETDIRTEDTVDTIITAPVIVTIMAHGSHWQLLAPAW